MIFTRQGHVQAAHRWLLTRRGSTLAIGGDGQARHRYDRGMSKQSPIRKLRRDRSRLQQELALAQGTDDAAQIPVLTKRIRDLDKEIAALEAMRTAG